MYDAKSQSRWKSPVVLGAIIAGFLIIRLPVAYRQPGGHDEEFFAFPGLTILSDGIPRAPHVPQRDPTWVFYKADNAFFVEPPLFFYVQAAFYALLPDVYGTARMPSLTAGVFAIALVYVLACRWYGDQTIALWAAGAYSLLRMFYFPAITARPDLLCTALGIGALYAFDRWTQEKKRRWFVGSGVLIGLGGLTHPFALIYAVQLAVWACWRERRWRRLLVPLLLAVIAMATSSLWLPLILAFPEEFREQFGQTITNRAGPGLFSRILSPWAALSRQADVAWERAESIRFCLSLAALLTAAVIDGRNRDGRQKPVFLAVSTILLMSMIAGMRPGYGYWSYPAAFFAMCLGSVVVRGGRRLFGPSPQRTWAKATAGALAVLVLVPGLGLRTWWAYVSHWNDIDYNAPRFADAIMDDLPADARYVVGIEYVLDFYAAGRNTLLGETYDLYFQSKGQPYDYLVVGRDGLNLGLPEEMQGQLLRTYGTRDDPFANYAEVYVPAELTQ